MADIKLLNLDDFGDKEVVTIVLNGKQHKLAEMTVKDFIWVQKEIKRQEKLDDEVAVFESLVTMLAHQFPTVSKEEFESLPMLKLRKLMDFVNALSQQGAEAVTKTPENPENSENPPKADQAA